MVKETCKPIFLIYQYYKDKSTH